MPRKAHTFFLQVLIFPCVFEGDSPKSCEGVHFLMPRMNFAMMALESNCNTPRNAHAVFFFHLLNASHGAYYLFYKYWFSHGFLKAIPQKRVRVCIFLIPRMNFAYAPVFHMPPHAQDFNSSGMRIQGACV